MTAQAVDEWLAEAAVHFQQGRLQQAHALYGRVLQSRPTDSQALQAMGLLLYQLGKPADALVMFKAALAAEPQLAAAHIAAGHVLLESGQYLQATAHFESALTSLPGDPETLTGLGMAQAAARRHADATASYAAALAQAPSAAEIHYNLGNSLLALQRNTEAIASYGRAIELRPQFAEAWNNRGAALRALGRLEEALACFRETLRLDPRCADALHNTGDVLFRTAQWDEAIGMYDRALASNPAYPYTAGAALLATMTVCDWKSYPQRREYALRGVDAGQRAAVPLAVALTSSSAEQLCRCAQTWVADQYPAGAEQLWRGERYAHERIRIAYLSADFHDHPVGYSITGLIERHDRSRFEVLGVSFRPSQPQSATRAQLERSFDRFIDVSTLTDEQVARSLRDLEVDIAVDLMGHTDGSRTGIFAFRPAPVQVSYLGYPGTTGASYVDYLLADRIALPAHDQPHFVEKVVYLPHCYLPNDHRQLPVVPVPTREQAGLPQDGFVFCAFNNTCKITPEVFDVWMRLLLEIPASVLWLSGRNAAAAANLRARATRYRIEAERLIFAPRLGKLEEHIARHRLADLFLDTLPYNAHTTAADALWAAVPVVTCLGNTMAGRASASLLTALGLEELITHSLADYGRTARALAREPERLAEARERLDRNRIDSVVFDTARYCRDLEKGFIGMWARKQRDEAACSFAVDPHSTDI